MSNSQLRLAPRVGLRATAIIAAICAVPSAASDALEEIAAEPSFDLSINAAGDENESGTAVATAENQSPQAAPPRLRPRQRGPNLIL